jgi:hypothetical protein
MRKISFLVVFVAALCFTGCAKKDEDSSFKNRILGNWMAVSADYTQISLEWGFFYEGSIKFYPDNSFAVNVSAATPDNGDFKMGTWKLKNNNSSIIFYSVLNDLGTIKRDTTEFKISIDSTGKLILENDQNLIKHKRIE